MEELAARRPGQLEGVTVSTVAVDFRRAEDEGSGCIGGRLYDAAHGGVNGEEIRMTNDPMTNQIRKPE